ncbi:MAG: hypothetical protein GF333_05005 [Candidatus Omnitrophica bacterium]|nr:hypothetical protein [Candidatus Omnitrophota bacterium]
MSFIEMLSMSNFPSSQDLRPEHIIDSEKMPQTKFAQFLQKLSRAFTENDALTGEETAVSETINAFLQELRAFFQSLGMDEEQVREMVNAAAEKIFALAAQGDLAGVQALIEQLLSSETAAEAGKILSEAVAWGQSKGPAASFSELIPEETGKSHPGKGGAALPEAETGRTRPMQELAALLRRYVPEKGNHPSPAQLLPEVLAALEEKAAAEAEGYRFLAAPGQEKDFFPWVTHSAEAQQELLDALAAGMMVKESQAGTAAGEVSFDIVEAQPEARAEFLQLIKEMVSRMELRNRGTTWKSFLELTTKELGNTHVRLELSGTKVILNLLVARAEAKDTVNNYLPELKQMLEERGLVLDGCSVDVDQNLRHGRSPFAQEFIPRENRMPGYEALSSTLVEKLQARGTQLDEMIVIGEQRVNCFA